MPVTHRPAQSLLEAILAIGVILTTVISATTLIVTTISTGQVSKDNIQAANFAREGLEIIRGVRDSNWLQRQQNVTNPATGTLFAWDDNPYGGVSTAKLVNGPWVFVYDTTLGRWKLRTAASSSAILAHPTGQFYYIQNCSVNCTATKFSRTVAVSQTTETILGGTVPYLDVTSTVTWQNHGNKQYSITERLYDWR